MMKPKMPKPKRIGPRRPFGMRAAFGSSQPKQAFRDPATMAAPDQAFTTAMAQPQNGAASLPAMPSPTPGE